jgi:hypothetical protein
VNFSGKNEAERRGTVGWSGIKDFLTLASKQTAGALPVKLNCLKPTAFISLPKNAFSVCLINHRYDAS